MKHCRKARLFKTFFCDVKKIRAALSACNIATHFYFRKSIYFCGVKPIKTYKEDEQETVSFNGEQKALRCVRRHW